MSRTKVDVIPRVWGRRALARPLESWPLRQTSGRTYPAAIFGYLSVECPSNKFYGINCRSKLGAKLLDRFFHRRRQVSPPGHSLTHRLFDGSQHFLYRNFTVGPRHSAVASSPVPMRV